MIGWAGRWTQTPSTTLLQPKKWNTCFWITFNFWWLARLVDGLGPHLPPISSQKHEMLIFGLCSTSDDQMAWLMDSNPICNPSAARKMKCSFLDYVQFLMIGQAGWWTWTPSTTPLHLKKWNAHFWIMFNFWWSAVLVDVLKSLLPPLSSQKYEMLFLKLCSTSDDWPSWLMDSKSICNRSAAKNEMLLFGFRSTSDDWTGWSMDSNPICDPSPAKKMKCLFLDYIQLLMIGWAGRWTWTPSPAKIMKCSFLDYVQLLMISWAGRWTQTPSATPLQPKTWNTHFWITFNIWWSARLVDGLEPHMPNLFTQNNEMLIFGLHSTSDDQLGWSMDSNPVCHLSPATKMKCSFLDYIQLLMISWLVNGLEPHLPPLSSHKKEMLIFGLRSTSDDWLGWSMDSNPIYHPSPPKKMKYLFLDYVQLLMIGQAGRWT